MRRERDAEYVLGSSDSEQERLRAQGDAIGPISEHLLVQSGIRAGMRVLDIGCGAGDLSLIAAKLVGTGGEVVGIDREPRMIEAARGRAHELDWSHVHFAEGDFRELGPDFGEFDAVVGRLVLMYQSDPVEALRRVLRSLRRGGVVVIQEYDSTLPSASLAPLPLHQQVRSWIWQTLERSGADGQMGFKLYSVLNQAGLSAPEVRAEAIVQTPATRYPTVPLIRILLPRIVAYGIASEAEVDIDTLETRLIEERERTGSTYVGQLVFGAWALYDGT